jgi:hypothetical protein
MPFFLTTLELVRFANGELNQPVTHRTMAGMPLYMTIFIILFPFMQGPLTLYRLPEALPLWSHYALMVLSGFTLVTLANFQMLIEYPFDQKGWDDVKVEEFLLEK